MTAPDDRAPTPLTDAITLGEWEYHKAYDDDGHTKHVAALDYEVMRDHARQLESVNAALREEQFRARAEAFKAGFDGGSLDEIIAALRARIEAMEGLLKEAQHAIAMETEFCVAANLSGRIDAALKERPNG